MREDATHELRQTNDLEAAATLDPTHALIQRSSADRKSFVAAEPTDMQPTTTYWRGKSGRLYRHSAHTTIYCPPPSHGVYVLARRDSSGAVVPLYAGVSAASAATLNLARIRQRAAQLGASEVHLCPLTVTGSVFGLRRILRDVRANFATRH